MPVPKLDRYIVTIGGTKIGEYPFGALELGSEEGILDIGYIGALA